MSKPNVTIAVDCTRIKGGYTARWKAADEVNGTKRKRYPWVYMTEGPSYRGKLKKFKTKKLARAEAVEQASQLAEYGYDSLHPALTHED